LEEFMLNGIVVFSLLWSLGTFKPSVLGGVHLAEGLTYAFPYIDSLYRFYGHAHKKGRPRVFQGEMHEVNFFVLGK